MQTILVSGSESQIGKSMLKNINYKKKNIFFLNKKQLNILDEVLIKKIFNKIKPKIFINLSAFTNVDKAENKINEAFDVNGHALKVLSLLCNEYDCKLIHFSTDYVFDGKNKSKYIESDLTNPKTVYGKSKLLGENNIKKYCKDYLIIRISHLYSNFKKNIVLNIINSMKKNNLDMVNDYEFIPTSTNNVNNFLTFFINNSKLYEKTNKIFNLCDNGEKVTPFLLSNYINNKINIVSSKNIKEINYSDYVSQTNRPKNTVLDNTYLKEYFDFEFNDWQSEVDIIIKEYIKNN